MEQLDEKLSGSNISFVGSYLKEVDELRVEWSLEISKSGISPRPYPLFWVGSNDKARRINVYSQLSKLLSVLKCPPNILEYQKKLATFSFCQGIGIPLNGTSKRYCFYVNFEDAATGEEIKEAFKWDDFEQEQVSYTFHSFTDVFHNANPKTHIHPDLQMIFGHFVDDQDLIEKSGFWLKRKNQIIKEVYLTYPWHPEVHLIVKFLKEFIPDQQLNHLSGHASRNFRHIGFSSVIVNDPVVTLYFSSYLQGKWPTSFEEIQKRVDLRNKALNQQLRHSLKKY